MCGILYTNLKSNLRNLDGFRADFENALDVMRYRGTDSIGVENLGTHYFGHVRLSIIDLKDSSNQPFQDDENLLIFNGEIYNYKDIDQNSLSDTATLFNQMKRKQNQFSALRGVFAFGWFNKVTEEVSFYRDFYGEKPLYYYSDKDIDVVSSTLKSLKHVLHAVGKDLEINYEVIKSDFMLFGYIREPHTIWRDVYMVSPGHKMSFSNSLTHLTPLNFEIKDSYYNWDKSDYIKNALLSTDVPGTLLLSAGIDSTYVLSQAMKNKISLNLGLYKAENIEIDESKDALANLEKFDYSKKDFPINLILSTNFGLVQLEEFCSLLEQPSSDGLQLYNLLKQIKAKVPALKLVYTGLGGDEMFGGYPTFLNYSKIRLLVLIPFIEKLYPKMERFVFGYKVFGFFDADLYSFLYRLNYEIFNKIYTDRAIIKKIYKRYKESLDKLPSEVKSMNFKDEYYSIKKNETFQYCMNQLLRDNDNISMFLGLESRSPLLNPDWYAQKPDGKLGLKNYLKKGFGIGFGQKKGFGLDENPLRKIYIEYIKLNIMFIKNQKLSALFMNYEESSVAELRKLALLCGWLKYNSK